MLKPWRLTTRRLLLLAISVGGFIAEVEVAGAIAQEPATSQADMGALSVVVERGVRGHIDTLRIRVPGGPSDRKFFRIVRPKGYRVAYAFVADTGFQNLLVMVGNDLVPSKGEVVVGKGQVLIVSADRAVRLRPENTKLFDLLRAQLTAKDPVMAHRRVSCEMDRLLTLYSGARADTLIREAEFLAIDPIRDREALRRVDRALAGKIFRAGCDTTQSRK